MSASEQQVSQVKSALDSAKSAANARHNPSQKPGTGNPPSNPGGPKK